jgi:hypothetical protein
VTGVPRQLRIEAASPGTEFEIRWTADFHRNPAEWELVASARSTGATITIDLPVRSSGLWLIWITQVPADGDRYRTAIGEVSFR